MKPEVFVANIGECGFGFPQSITRRRQALQLDTSHDGLLELLKYWDLSDLRVGMITFLSEPTIAHDKIQVGEVEADLLYSDGTSHRLFVEELHHPGHRLWDVAGNGEQFLDALIYSRVFLKRRGSGQIAYDDLETAKATAIECGLLAGGDRFRDFYLMLFS